MIAEGYDIYNLLDNVIHVYLDEEFGIWEGDFDKNTLELSFLIQEADLHKDEEL